MRENTGRQIVTTVNFADGAAASHEWTEAEQASLGIIDAYAEDHLVNNLDANGYRIVTDVWEYREAGLRVVALVVDGQVETAFSVEDWDVARYHRAVREQRSMTIRYVKADGDVTRRRVEPTSVRLTKDGNIVVRAYDRRRDAERSFRADRITHTTLHRDRFVPAPSKEALAAAFQEHVRATEATSPWDLLDPASPAAPAEVSLAAASRQLADSLGWNSSPAAVAAWRGYRPAGETPGKIIL